MLTKNHNILDAEVKAHINADAVIQGDYWDGQKGCFIGCLAHSSDAAVLQERFGLPLLLVKICENIFEALSESEAKEFFAAIPDAVGHDGKDLSRVHWQFLADELRAMPPAQNDVQAAVNAVINGVDLLARGEDWPDCQLRAACAAADAAADAACADADAAYAAADTYAAYAARAADAAAFAAHADNADAAAYAAADAAYAAARAAAAARVDRAAADAAAYAARVRQRDTILALIKAA